MVMRLIKVALAGRWRLIEPPAYSLSPTMISDAKRAFLEQGASVDHIYVDGFSFQSRA